MADEREAPKETEKAPVPAPSVAPDPSRKITDNPGEGEHMFTDWALI